MHEAWSGNAVALNFLKSSIKILNLFLRLSELGFETSELAVCVDCVGGCVGWEGSVGTWYSCWEGLVGRGHPEGGVGRVGGS